MVESLFPPHSRLFIGCDKETTEEDLLEAFKKYGNIHNCNLCRNRSTGQPKGVAFIQFDKTSEAAAALEALNGKTIGHSSRPLRITVAVPKDHSGSTNSIDPSQYLRLFLVVPKSATEDDLREYFSQFGEIDYVAVVKDRETKESKGFAFVKYFMFSDAARAYENCDPQYKVVFAKPKDQSSRKEDYYSAVSSYSKRTTTCTHIDENPDGFTTLIATVSADLTDDQIEWLFNIPPGLLRVRFFTDPVSDYDYDYKRKVQLIYDSPGTAAYALRKLHGFEYPVGIRVVVRPDFQNIGRSQPPRDIGWEQGAGSSTPSVSELMRKVESLTKSLREATHLAKMAGVEVPASATNQIDTLNCTAKLPPPQPLAPPDSVMQERLFLVFEPGLPPPDALWDVFSRFGNLIEVYILNGKNCGYAKYASKESAVKALETLNGEHLYRMRMKVVIAEPNTHENRKRQRTNY